MMLVNDYVTNEKWVDTESLVWVAMTILCCLDSFTIYYKKLDWLHLQTSSRISMSSLLLKVKSGFIVPQRQDSESAFTEWLVRAQEWAICYYIYDHWILSTTVRRVLILFPFLQKRVETQRGLGCLNHWAGRLHCYQESRREKKCKFS